MISNLSHLRCTDYGRCTVQSRWILVCYVCVCVCEIILITHRPCNATQKKHRHRNKTTAFVFSHRKTGFLWGIKAQACDINSMNKNDVPLWWNTHLFVITVHNFYLLCFEHMKNGRIQFFNISLRSKGLKCEHNTI